MPLSRRESKEIVDWVVSEIMKRRFNYVTDGRLDLSKSPVGTVSGTQTTGGTIADGAIWNRHVNDNADIQGTKVRVATTSERGTVTLGTGGSAIVPTMSGLQTTVSGLGASLIGIYDAEGNFSSTNVEDVLRELFQVLGAVTFLDLIDTPNSYNAPWNTEGRVPTINESETGLEFKPVDYVESEFVGDDGGGVLNKESVDGGSLVGIDILEGGNFSDADTIKHLNDLGGEVIISGVGVVVSKTVQVITISGEAPGSVATHAALTATHGASGAVVGTNNTQELDNKTLDASVAKGTWTTSNWIIEKDSLPYIKSRPSSSGPWYSEITDSKAIPNNTPTGLITIVVPNDYEGGAVKLDYLINDIGDAARIYSGGRFVTFYRLYNGATSKADYAYITEQTVGGGATIANTFTLSANIGANNEEQKFNIEVTCSGSSDSRMHYHATLLSANYNENGVEPTFSGT